MILPLILVAVLLPQVVEPIDVGINSGDDFGFDWNGEHTDGSPMAVTKAVEFHYIPVPPTLSDPGTGDGHVTVIVPLVAVVGENVVTMKLALVSVPMGVYDLDIRLIGAGGNPSEYSQRLRVRIKNPAPPTGLRVVGK